MIFNKNFLSYIFLQNKKEIFDLSDNSLYINEKIINSIDVGIIIIDCKNNVTFINPKAIDFLHQSNEMPVCGCNLNVLFPHSQQVKLNRLLQKRELNDSFDVFTVANLIKLKIEIKHFVDDRYILVLSDITFFTDYSDRIEKLNLKLNSLLSRLSDFVILFDDQLLIQNIWSQSEQMLFYPKNFIIGRRLTDVINLDFSFKIEEEVKEVLLGANYRSIEYKHPTIPDIWMSANIYSVFVAEELLVACIITDITKNKLNIEQLQHNTSQLENIVDNKSKELNISKSALDLALNTAQIGTWQYYPENNELVLDNNYLQLISDGEPVQISHVEDFLQFVDNSDKQRFVEELNLSLANKSEYNSYIKIITPKNNIKWLHGKGNFYKDSKGNYTCLMGSTADITDLKITELKLKTTEQKYKQLLSSMSQACALHEVVFDNQGMPKDIKYLEINSSFENVLGVKAKDVIGKTGRELLKGPSQKIIKDFIDVALSGIPKTIDNYIPEQNKYYQMFIYKPEKNQVASLISDITNRKIIENELFNTHKELNEANKLKSVILGNVNHELRSPLNGILGFAQMMEKEIADEEHKEFLGYIIESAERLKRTLNGLLSLTDLEYGHLEIKKENTNMVEFVRSIFYSLETIVKKKNLDFTFKSNTENINFETDLNLLNQVIMSLVDNAVKYTNDGKIGLKVNLDEFTRIFNISVEDTGCGIAESDSTLR